MQAHPLYQAVKLSTMTGDTTPEKHRLYE